MTLGDGIDALGEAMMIPFTEKEEERFILSRESHVNGVLERIQYHNFAVIRKIHDWISFIKGHGPRPVDELVRFIIPGRNQENPELSCFDDIAGFYAAFPHGASPALDALGNASKSCVSLMHNLAAISESDHLRNANQHFREFMRLIRYHGEPRMLRDEFARRIADTRDNFIRERTANAIEVGKFLATAGAGAQLAPNKSPVSVRKDELRTRAVSLIKGYQKLNNCTQREAIEKVQKILWKEFDALILKSGMNNLRHLLHDPKFKDAPPTDVDGLRAAGLEV